MPVLPSRNLKKYSSLPGDSPDVSIAKSEVTRFSSAGTTGQKLVGAFLNLRKRSDENLESSYEKSGTYSFEETKLESSRMMPASQSSSPAADPSRPHLTPYFQKKNNPQKELVSSIEEKLRPEKRPEEYSKLGSKRPTLNPFFNANHHFMKVLRRMGNKDNFNRLKPRWDD